MVNLILALIAEKSIKDNEGGLFDFNATLPLMALQFLILMSLLNIIFYKPVAKILDNRDEYIRNSLTTASATLSKANKLILQYEQELARARREAQEIIRKSQKEAQKKVLIEVKAAQITAENLVNEASRQLIIEKEQALKTLEDQVEELSDQIKSKLLNDHSLI